jgi:hypothetical protein
MYDVHLDHIHFCLQFIDPTPNPKVSPLLLPCFQPFRGAILPVIPNGTWMSIIYALEQMTRLSDDTHVSN